MALDPYRYFRVEARDLLDQFATGILELEKGGSSVLVRRLLRLAHTLKGAAGVVKEPEIAERAHAIEDVLAPLRETVDGISRAQIDLILAHLDDIERRIQALAPAEAAEPVQGKPGFHDGLRTVRSDVAELDAVLDGISETHTLLNGLRAATRSLEREQHEADLLLAQLSPRPGAQPGYSRERLVSIVEDLRRRLGGLDHTLNSAVDQMDRELRQTRDAAEQLRLVPAGTLFTSLERTARDVAGSQSKQVLFESEGGDIRLDIHVIETIQGALAQIVRNAVAHGIETVSERRISGKLDSGRVRVKVGRRGGHIVFECSDDGRGIDLDAVRRRAEARGLSPAKRVSNGCGSARPPAFGRRDQHFSGYHPDSRAGYRPRRGARST